MSIYKNLIQRLNALMEDGTTVVHESILPQFKRYTTKARFSVSIIQLSDTLYRVSLDLTEGENIIIRTDGSHVQNEE